MKYLTAAVAACALTVAPSAQADPGQADLESPFSTAGHPFVGTWGAHGERVVVSADGTGTETYGGGTMSFTLGSVPKAQPQTASGNITGGGNAPVGSWVTMQLVDGGRGMLFSAANGDQGFPFCKYVNGDYLNSADCGA